MIRVLRNTWATALLIITVVEVFMQVDRSVAQNSDSRSPVRRSAIGFQRYRRRHISNPPCINGISNDDDNFSNIETKIRETEFVFTGKVTAENKDEETADGASKYSVRVKRVLKGGLPFRTDSGEDLRNKQMTVKIRTMDKPKTPRNCYKRPIRVHHTAIFLAKKLQDISGDGMLQLTSDPLPLTLRNLDKVNAAVKDMTYKPRPPIIEEPCEKTYCAYGANCVQTADGRAECQCPSECPAMFTPVCGTDGVTYTNHCMMRMKSCRQEKNTRVQHAGECDPRSPKRRHRG